MEAEKLLDRVTLRGKLAVINTCFNDISGEVIVRGTVLYHGTEFRDIPILTLRIYEEMGKVKFQEIWYTARIPRLEAISAFRLKLCKQLEFWQGVNLYPRDAILPVGVGLYIDRLRNFHPGISLVRSLRHISNSLSESRSTDWHRASAALYALGVVPAIHVELIIED